MLHRRLSFVAPIAVVMLSILAACGGGGGGGSSSGGGASSSTSSASSSSSSSIPVVTGYTPGADIQVSQTGVLSAIPRVAVLTNGTIAVVWDEPTSSTPSLISVAFELLNASGTAISGRIAVDPANAGKQEIPDIAALSNGNFVVTWSDTSKTLGDSDGYSIKAQIFNSSGNAVGGPFLVNTTVANNQYLSAISPLSNGGFVIVWLDEDNNSPGQRRVMGQMFTAAGAKSGSEKVIGSRTSSQLGQDAVSGLAGGGFVAAWQDDSHSLGDTDGFAIYAQRFDASGSASGSVVRVNTQTALDQGGPHVLALLNGGYVITWTDYGTQLGGGDISAKGQMYSSAGAATGSEFVIAAPLSGADQFAGGGTGLANGNFVVGWANEDAIITTRGQVYDQTGAKFGADFAVPAAPATNAYNSVGADFAPTSNGGFVAVWTDNVGNSSSVVKMRVFAAQ